MIKAKILNSLFTAPTWLGLIISHTQLSLPLVLLTLHSHSAIAPLYVLWSCWVTSTLAFQVSAKCPFLSEATSRRSGYITWISYTLLYFFPQITDLRVCDFIFYINSVISESLFLSPMRLPTPRKQELLSSGTTLPQCPTELLKWAISWLPEWLPILKHKFMDSPLDLQK